LSEFITVPLGAASARSPDYDLTTLDSGQRELDRWLAEHAADSQRRRTARTFIHLSETNVALAYYSLAAHVLQQAELPRTLARGEPRQIPAVVLARLALDRSLQGHGLGGALLADALLRIVHASETVGARYVVVDAIDEPAATFYEHYGFRRIPTTRRLVQSINDIAAALRAASSPKAPTDS
jgi:GNAT superfamily N-acetyltransferase